MNKAAEFYQGLNESLKNALNRVKPFRAIVHDVTSAGVQIKELGADAPLDEPFARLAGPAVAVDDDVVVVMVGERPFVLGKIVRGTSDGETFDFPVLIEVNSNDAFLVSKEDGTELFRVDTDTPSQVALMNGVHLSGYASEDRSGTTLFNIDSSNGNARFNDITGSSFNSPIITTASQNSADTGSTTNTSTYQTALTTSFSLPTGTWSIYAVGGLQLTHSSGASANFQVNINSDPGAGRSSSFSSTVFGMGVDNNEKAGVTSSATVAVEYKSNSAGTTTAKNPWLIVVARRTA